MKMSIRADCLLFRQQQNTNENVYTCRLFVVHVQKVCMVGQLLSVRVSEAGVWTAGLPVIHRPSRLANIVLVHLQHCCQHLLIVDLVRWFVDTPLSLKTNHNV